MIRSNVMSFLAQPRASAVHRAEIKSCEHFHVELERRQAMAQRDHHRFTLLIFHVQAPGAGQIETKKLAVALIRRIRSTDELGWMSNHQLGVILPDSSTLNAAGLADEVRRLAQKESTAVQYTVYAFPSQGRSGSGGHGSAQPRPTFKTSLSRCAYQPLSVPCLSC